MYKRQLLSEALSSLALFKRDAGAQAETSKPPAKEKKAAETTIANTTDDRTTVVVEDKKAEL